MHVVSRTGLEPVFPPWKGGELTCYSSGTFVYREPESNWHGHFCPSDFKSDVSTNFTIPAHHRNKLNKTNCGGCRTRTCISFPNGCLVDSSCTDWGNPPKNVEPKISKLPQTVSYRHWKISWMFRSISSNPLFRHKPMWWFSLASLDYCHQRSIAWQLNLMRIG